MEDFVLEATRHAARCGHELMILKKDTRQSAGVKELWKCRACHSLLELANCDWVKTNVVETDRKCSRLHGEINLQIASWFSAGVNMTKAMEFVTNKLGVKMATPKNVLHQKRSSA